MHISVAEARNHLTRLLRAVEQGEEVIITRNGKPVAQLAPPQLKKQGIQWGAMRERIQLLPGWDEPVDLHAFLSGNL